MNEMFGKIKGALTGRWARNIYFWAFFIFSRLGDPTHTRWQITITLILIAQLAILSYVNNLFLIPRYLALKKTKTYFLLAALLCTSITFSYSYTLKLMLHYFPGYTVSSVSLFVGRATGNLSFSSLLHETDPSGSIVWLVMFTMAWFLMDYSRQQKAAEEARRRQVEVELLFLKGQINPHFLFNTLNNLYGLCLAKSDNSADAVLKLSSILRYLLYESNSGKVEFSKEQEVMLAYIDLERLRLGEKDGLNFSIMADKVYSVPPLLWLPVLENVFKHGTRFLDDDYTIDYRFSIENDLLTIYSRNNYDLSNYDIDKAKGIGLSNLKYRLDILYPGQYAIETNRDGKYYVVKVEIKLN